MPNNTINSTTQKFLDIFDITNNLVIMKDGTTSLIIAVDAMNFGLLAEEEQDSIMYAYAGLLNSLNYPIQILIRSQTKDVTGYLHLLKDQEDASSDRSRQKRIRKYREFVGNLIRERNVLDKKFFVVIPASPIELGIMPVSGVLPGKKTPDINSSDKNLIIEKARNILESKRDHLISQFARIGLYSRQLETQEIIQLFYLSYNPEASEGQEIGNSNSYTAPLVTAKIEGNPMNDAQVQNPTTTQQTGETPAAATQTPIEESQPATPAPGVIPQTNPMTPPTNPIAQASPVVTPSATSAAPVTPPISPTPASTAPAINTADQPATTIPNAPVVPQETEVVIKHPEEDKQSSSDVSEKPATEEVKTKPTTKVVTEEQGDSQVDVEKAPPLPEI